MNIVFVVTHLPTWDLHLPEVKLVESAAYLAEQEWADCRDTRIFNLCDSYAYQDHGYYVSLLAEARGHAPLPDVRSIEDLPTDTSRDAVNDSVLDMLQHALVGVTADRSSFDVYFGRHPDPALANLGEHLFNQLQIPLLRVTCERQQDEWRIAEMQALHLPDIAATQRTLFQRAAGECSQAHCKRPREPAARRPRLAILMSPDAAPHPSNQPALLLFQRAAERLGMDTAVISKDDTLQLSEFDGLFIRDTTNVNHYTYQMARQAEQAGLVVIDDPESILRCTNKVYLTELLNRHRIAIPKTVLVQQENLAEVIPTLGLPCVLKQPDGAFSQGVVKVHSKEELHERAAQLLAGSSIILAQEYLPTEFDWRVGVLDRRALFVCKYYMAKGHWQIIKHSGDAAPTEGMAKAFALGEVPNEVIDMAVKAANLIGDGFYGVDLKQVDGRVCVIEINDNPNVDMGNEDGVLQQALYLEIMAVFRKRIEARKAAQS